MQNGKGLIWFGLFLGLAIVISAYLVTDTLRDIKLANQIIKVRGYSETQVESDLAIWNITITTRQAVRADAYDELANHRKRVKEYLIEKGVTDDEINMQSVYVYQQMKRTDTGRETSEIEAYEITQNIEVKSGDVYNLQSISTEISDLIGEGINVQANMPRYYYTGVNDLKSQLLIDATKDARERAKTLAEGSGVNLGVLRAARQGVFSVRSGDSSSISEEVSDDVSSIDKKITAVVTVDYAME